MFAVRAAPSLYGAMCLAALGAEADLINPTTASYALIGGFSAMLALQAWIIKFLLTRQNETIEKQTASISALKESISALRESVAPEKKVLHA